MQNQMQSNKTGSFSRIIGHIVYRSYELRFLNRGELSTIKLSDFNFELLVDNTIGQNQLMKKHGGDELVGLVSIFRNEDQTSITINFNKKETKVYNFTKDVSNLNFISTIDFKKMYLELSKA